MHMRDDAVMLRPVANQAEWHPSARVHPRIFVKAMDQ